MSADLLFVLLLWDGDAGRWVKTGTGTRAEMEMAHNATVQTLSTLDVRYGAAPHLLVVRDGETPVPLHSPRRVTLELPAGSPDGDADTWQGLVGRGEDGVGWEVRTTRDVVEACLGPDESGCVSVSRAPRGIAVDDALEQLRALGLALVAATQPVAGGAR